MANISHFTQTVNGVSTTYDIRDANAVPLSGSNAISGSLIPSTDNSIDIGSSTKNIKMLYTKGITINRKTVDTDANGNLVYDGHIVDTIEEQGTGYIRYSNGIQICWGTISWQSDCKNSWGSLFETIVGIETYAKSFVENPAVSISGNIGGSSAIIESNAGSNTSTPNIYLCRATAINTVQTCSACYIAIGRWK